jgi:2-polyprenyl-3-methyl-5-hydroxy-6-metoxy-1,4-benzoquinol methylase
MTTHPIDDVYRSYRAFDRGDASNSAGDALFAKAYLLPYLAPFKGDEVLEIGAGTGGMLRALEDAGWSRVSGVDCSASQVRRAEELGSRIELGDAVEVLAARARASLGAIVALDVLEHLTIDDLLRVVELASDRLRPGGVLVARVPNGEGLFGGAILHGDISHLRAFTSRSVTQTLSLYGLELVTVRPVRPIVHGPASAARAALWALIETITRLASAAETGRLDALVTRNILAVARRPS